MLRVPNLVKIKKNLLYVFSVLIEEKEGLPTCVKSCYLTQFQDLIPLTKEILSRLSNMLHVHYNRIITPARVNIWFNGKEKQK